MDVVNNIHFDTETCLMFIGINYRLTCSQTYFSRIIEFRWQLWQKTSCLQDVSIHWCHPYPYILTVRRTTKMGINILNKQFICKFEKRRYMFDLHWGNFFFWVWVNVFGWGYSGGCPCMDLVVYLRYYFKSWMNSFLHFIHIECNGAIVVALDSKAIEAGTIILQVMLLSTYDSVCKYIDHISPWPNAIIIVSDILSI